MSGILNMGCSVLVVTCTGIPKSKGWPRIMPFQILGKSSPRWRAATQRSSKPSARSDFTDFHHINGTLFENSQKKIVIFDPDQCSDFLPEIRWAPAVKPKYRRTNSNMAAISFNGSAGWRPTNATLSVATARTAPS